MKQTGLPTVAVLIPCRSEEEFIGRTLDDVLQGDYPRDLMEIYVLDGMSTDGTRAIVKQFTNKYEQVHLIDNPGGSKPKALNLGISLSASDIVIRLDAHATYPKDYISKLVRNLVDRNVDNIGGVRRNVSRSDGLMAETLARVLTSSFGVGDAKHYTGAEGPFETDIVFLFCVRRTLFDEVGLFDERLTRGQDREFNLRLSRLGKKMLIVPDVECTYFARDKLSTFVPWAFECGATPLRISQLVGRNLTSIRNLVPVAFVLWLALSALLSVFWAPALILFGVGFSSYLLTATAFAIKESVKARSPVYFLTLPLAYLVWHIAYGLGFLWQYLHRARQTSS